MLLFGSINLKAQTKPDSTLKGTDYSIGTEFLFAFNNCFKTWIEVKPLQKSFGIELTPEVYLSDYYSLGFNRDKITGVGLGLYGKKYFGKLINSPLMFNAGATLRSINVGYSDKGFIPFQEDGQRYYRYASFNDVLKIHSMLVNCTIQGRLTNSPIFFLDVYAGVGYKFSTSSSTYPGYRSYNSHTTDYAYRGALFLAGIKTTFNSRQLSRTGKK
ncbi:hypothetical protein C8P68_105350 [Mucilaginibacter yixingensis]|uniref:Outer membrane protein with beta-barrel domain n=2 Tax=Mucilaginibacter yixingensis TaxID=1295612 RepID=A0A2T5J8W4_9SPHI|nr:hypothetical protein C8P68_105350 [Mucilaginibacter yixingensis]